MYPKLQWAQNNVFDEIPPKGKAYKNESLWKVLILIFLPSSQSKENFYSFPAKRCRMKIKKWFENFSFLYISLLLRAIFACRDSVFQGWQGKKSLNWNFNVRQKNSTSHQSGKTLSQVARNLFLFYSFPVVVVFLHGKSQQTTSKGGFKDLRILSLSPFYN